MPNRNRNIGRRKRRKRKRGREGRQRRVQGDLTRSQRTEGREQGPGRVQAGKPLIIMKLTNLFSGRVSNQTMKEINDKVNSGAGHQAILNIIKNPELGFSEKDIELFSGRIMQIFRPQ